MSSKATSKFFILGITPTWNASTWSSSWGQLVWKTFLDCRGLLWPGAASWNLHKDHSGPTADLQKVPKFPQMVNFGIWNFRKNMNKLKARLPTTNLFILWNQTKYLLYVGKHMKKKKLLHRQKFPQTNKICGNKMKACFCFVLIFTARFPQSIEFSKYPYICRNKHIFPLFCCVYVGKFSLILKISASGIRAICHFLQVRNTVHISTTLCILQTLEPQARPTYITIYSLLCSAQCALTSNSYIQSWM